MHTKIKITVSLLLIFLHIVLHSTKLPKHKERKPKRNLGRGYIPRIIHQLWNDQFVPRPVLPFMKTWIDQHPDWQYWFWTKESQEKFVREKYPAYLNLYKAYQLDIQRSDMIRFLILYEFGGVYADLDMEVLKPLDDIVEGKPCLLAAATEEVATVFLETNQTFITNNALIACKPRHRLLKLMLEGFFTGRRNKDVMSSTGPILCDSVVKKYMHKMSRYSNAIQKMRSQFNVLHVGAGNPDDDVHIAYSEYFLANFAAIHTHIMRLRCTKVLKEQRSNSSNSKDKRKLSICTMLDKSNYTRTTTAKSYTKHHWMGSWVPNTGWVDMHKHKKQTTSTDHVNIQKYFKRLNNMSGILKRIPL